MKKFYQLLLIGLPFILAYAIANAQCPAGSATANVNWDNLDYLTRAGTYSTFVTAGMMQTQKFALGRNRVSINIAAITTTGENTANTAEIGSFATGADVEYNGNGTIILTFDTVVRNVQFSLYDIDLLQTARVTAEDGSALPLNINISAVSAGVLTIAGNGTTIATSTSNNTIVANNDTRGTLNISVTGINPAPGNGVKKITIVTGGTAGNFWLSDIIACVFGAFPVNYYASQQPFINQPSYYMVTPDNNSVYLFNPITGVSDWLFSEPASPWVNSMAYDHVNKILYYVMDHSSPVATNKSLKKYDFNSESISTVIADLTTLDIPLYDIVVESAGAAFYNGSLYLGVEGTNGSKNASRESIIWRIDFDAMLKPSTVSQVFAFPADNGAGLLTHDWGDFTIKDGILYDFNTGNVGSTSSFIHYNLQTGTSVTFNSNGAPAPIQAGQTFDGKLYWTGGQSPENGKVALYNQNGTIGPKINITTSICSPPWVRRAGDASDPFRPKSDFGDAPASYDPTPLDKATHEFDCNLRLGATYDREWDKTPSANATADGTDEDGIGTVTSLRRGVFNYVQDIKVFNNTGSNATLTGWLDYNANGIFEATEGISIIVPTNAATQTVTLNWPNISVTLPLASTTFMRIRLTSAANNMTIDNPTRWFANGEVEDYPVFVNAVLPIEIKSFNAIPEKNSRVLLKWSTGIETSFRGYEIERSNDGLSWNILSFTKGYNNGGIENDYIQYDNNPAPGKTYYRLKMLSVDGTFRYSEIRSVIFKQLNSSVQVLPNPVRNAAKLRISIQSNQSVDMNIIDISGKKISNQKITLNQGVNEIILDNVNQLVPGVYVVQIVTKSDILNTKMIVQ